MHYLPHGCGPLPWERGPQWHRIVTSLRWGQGSAGESRLSAQRHCMASKDHGELCRSSSRPVQVELCRARFAQVCRCFTHLRPNWHATSHLARAFLASYCS